MAHVLLKGPSANVLIIGVLVASARVENNEAKPRIKAVYFGGRAK